MAGCVSFELTGDEVSQGELDKQGSVVVVVHTFEQIYLQDQLADFSQIVSLASLGWGERLH